MKLLFHCCCGPCAAACIEDLVAENIQPRLFWYNPNIHPYTEYSSRRGALAQLVSAQNLELDMIDEYGLRLFLRAIGCETESAADNTHTARCNVCYRMRLERAAAHAAAEGFDAFSTSLLISPYQNHDEIRRIGGELAAQYGVAFLYRDFRPRFREGQAQARALGLYMQKYCGCIFSEEERYLKPKQRQEHP
ncbi:hypothetical protein AGMMS50293_25810 [Spirochaetia bacterium]|nr:hypothetical protein AGMMS50293_25810 [Spirochaetia bacterium]